MKQQRLRNRSVTLDRQGMSLHVTHDSPVTTGDLQGTHVAAAAVLFQVHDTPLSIAV